jgi:DNA-binding response OmpR family regulator
VKVKILRVLIVEDSKERQEILKNLTRRHAWIAANTASIAIKYLSVFDFDLILLDYDLSGSGSGEDVARSYEHRPGSR